MTTSTRPSQSLLDLHVPQDPDGTVTATMPLSWCFKPETEVARLIQDRGFVRPYLLTIVRQNSMNRLDPDPLFHYEQWYDLRATAVPLTQGLQYLNFNRPGENQILAFVIDVHDSKSLKNLRNAVDIFNSGSGYHSIFNEDGAYEPSGDFRDLFFRYAFLRKSPDVLTVHVPQEMFAPEPAQWRKNIVTRIFSRSTAVDQCHFRKKFLVSLVVIPFLILAATLSKLGLLVAVPAVAPRRLAWRHLWRPFSSIVSFWDDAKDGTSWFFQEPDPYGDARFSWRTFLSPLVWWLPATLTWLVCRIPVHYTGSKTRTHPWIHTPDYWQFVALFDLVVLLGPVLAAGAITAVGWLFSKLFGLPFWATSRTERKRRREEKAKREKELERQRLLRELELMTCGDTPPPLSVGELPRDKQTVYLRFADLKTKVCKPFAG